jgi:hypothetical protein
MSKIDAEILFEECLINHQRLGSGKDKVVSRVHFSMNVAGRSYEGLYVDVLQPQGTNYESEPFEVVRVHDANGPFEGPMSHNALCEEVERFYRTAVGSTARGYGIDPAAKNVTLRNCSYRVNPPMRCSIKVEDPESGSGPGGW